MFYSFIQSRGRYIHQRQPVYQPTLTTLSFLWYTLLSVWSCSYYSVYLLEHHLALRITVKWTWSKAMFHFSSSLFLWRSCPWEWWSLKWFKDWWVVSVSCCLVSFLLSENVSLNVFKRYSFLFCQCALIESKRSYVRYISHELRTPLNAAFLGKWDKNLLVISSYWLHQKHSLAPEHQFLLLTISIAKVGCSDMLCYVDCASFVLTSSQDLSCLQMI